MACRGLFRRTCLAETARLGLRFDDLLRAEQRSAVQAGLRRLKPLDRQALEAFYLRGRSLKRIARELDVPVGTIKRRLHVARRRLKTVLEGAAPARRRRAVACV